MHIILRVEPLRSFNLNVFSRLLRILQMFLRSELLEGDGEL